MSCISTNTWYLALVSFLRPTSISPMHESNLFTMHFHFFFSAFFYVSGLCLFKDFYTHFFYKYFFLHTSSFLHIGILDVRSTKLSPWMISTIHLFPCTLVHPTSTGCQNMKEGEFLMIPNGHCRILVYVQVTHLHEMTG